MVAVVVMVGIVVAVVMQRGVPDGCHRIVKVRLDGKMDGDEVDVERKQQGSRQSTPPTRLGRRTPWMR